MRIGGKTINGPKEALLVLPRQDGDIAFKFVAVLDDTAFDKLCPEPKAPRTMKVGVGIVENTEDPEYIAKLRQRGEFREAWFFLESIKPTDIEWTTVKAEDCTTWANWREDLKAAGFSMTERDRIWYTFLETNLVTDKMVDEARSRFLASQQAKLQAVPSSPASEPGNTASGAPANAGV